MCNTSPYQIAEDIKLPQSRKFLLEKNFAKPTYLRIAETFFCMKFICQCGKDRHIVYVISNAGERICRYKLSPRVGGEVCHLDKLCIDWQCTYIDKLHKCGLSSLSYKIKFIVGFFARNTNLHQ